MIDFIGLASLRSDASQFEVPNPFLDQDGFVLVDASIVYTSDSGLYSIGVHGKNLFDKEYIVAGYNFVAGGVGGAPFVPDAGPRRHADRLLRRSAPRVRHGAGQLLKALSPRGGGL